MIATLPAVEDYAWLPNGKLLMAKDSKLFAVVPLTGAKWAEVADFSTAGIKRITRIAVNGNGTETKNGDVKASDALRVLRGEMR